MLRVVRNYSAEGEANARLARLAGELREENTRLRAENAAQAADLAVLRRMVFGWSSERLRPVPSADEVLTVIDKARR
jgi:C4-dicarboxylate-specific signal transduction histidine kinase